MWKIKFIKSKRFWTFGSFFSGFIVSYKPEETLICQVVLRNKRTNEEFLLKNINKEVLREINPKAKSHNDDITNTLLPELETGILVFLEYLIGTRNENNVEKIEQFLKDERFQKESDISKDVNYVSINDIIKNDNLGKINIFSSVPYQVRLKNFQKEISLEDCKSLEYKLQKNIKAIRISIPRDIEWVDLLSCLQRIILEKTTEKVLKDIRWLIINKLSADFKSKCETQEIFLDIDDNLKNKIVKESTEITKEELFYDQSKPISFKIQANNKIQYIYCFAEEDFFYIILFDDNDKRISGKDIKNYLAERKIIQLHQNILEKFSDHYEYILKFQDGNVKQIEISGITPNIFTPVPDKIVSLK